MSLGALTIHLVEAKFTRDVKTMRKMDPYGKLEMREQEWKSATCERGSTKPKWQDQHHTFDVKYLGDDIFMKFYDDDPGKDEIICTATQKVSAFCESPEMDFWVPVHWKNKSAGTVHFKSTWVPNEAEAPKEEHEDEMAKAQAYIKKMSDRKKELEDEWEEVKQVLADTDAEVKELRDNLVVCDCNAEEEAEIAAAHERYEKDMARIEKNKEMALVKVEDYKAAKAARIEKAEAYKEQFLAECDAEDAKADEDKEAKLARIEEMKANEEEEHAKELERLEAEIAATKEADQAKYDAVADEIKAIAEELLEYNEKMQEKLTALTML